MSPHATFLQRRSLAEARGLLLAGVGPVGAEEIAVDDATGRIVAADVFAARPSPHYRASAMDGIAVRSSDTWDAADTPVTLRALAPASPAPADGERACVPVDTGAALPDWTDAVVRIEDTTAANGGFRVKSVVPPGRDVRRAGEDFDAGVLLLPAGATIRAWDVGAMLATGTTRVPVRRRPRVAILATGGEVVEPSDGAGAGQVVESSSRVIAALVQQWGATAHRLGIVADDDAAMARAVADAAARFDVVCVIAGSAGGSRDRTVPTLASLGEVLVHGVDIAPGRPVALARVPSRDGAARAATPVLALPGYPVASVVVCETLLRPLLAALLGAAEAVRDTMRARVVRRLPSRLGVEEFRRVALVRRDADGEQSLVVAPLPSGAGLLGTLSGAHAWLRIPAHVEGLDEGADVDVELLVERADVDAAFVLAGPPCAESADLERALRRRDARARVVHLRLGPADAAAAVARGQAHGALFDTPGLVGVGPSLPVLSRRDGSVHVAVAGDDVARRVQAAWD